MNHPHRKISLPNDEEDEEKEGFGINATSLRNGATCLVPMNLEAEVIVNDTDKDMFHEVGNENIIIAPGEGKLPSRFLLEEHFDVKSQPRHHPTGRFGIHEPRDEKLSAQKYALQRIQNFDTRFCTDMSWVFMMQQYVERNAIQGQMQIAGRKGTIQKDSGASKKVHLNDPFNVFAKISGSPKFWQVERNNLIAKVKQLGPFHLFLTFSCAEMRWFDVFIAVLESKGIEVKFDEDDKMEWDGDERDITVNGIPLWDYIARREELHNETKHDMLKDCVYIATMHFDERVKSLFKNIILQGGKDYDGKEKVPIEHYSYRVEFQARGMPHIHAVAWIDKKWLAKTYEIHGELIDY